MYIVLYMAEKTEKETLEKNSFFFAIFSTFALFLLNSFFILLK